MSHINRIMVLGAVLCGLGFASTHTASSCSQADVDAVINGPTHTAVDGDVIQIPAGSCTWTSGITIPANIGITIKGSGTPNSSPSTFGAAASCTDTTITHNITSGGHIFRFRPTVSSSLSRISCLKVRTDNSTSIGASFTVAGVCNGTTCSQVRIDNITFDPSVQGQNPDSGSMVLTDNVFGVLDHNTVGGVDFSRGVEFVNFNNSKWEGVGELGDNSRSSPTTMGTEKTLYVENNSFGTAVVVTESEVEVPFGNWGGGRVAVRFNQMNGTWVGLSVHGLDSNGRARSPLQGEFYGNTLHCTVPMASGDYCQAVGARGGTYMVFGNTLTAEVTSKYNSYVDLQTYRTWSVNDPFGLCDGTGDWDNNTVSPPICLDQPARSGGSLLSGNPPTPTNADVGFVHQSIEPVYEWNNSGRAPNIANVTSGYSAVAINRDFYTDDSAGSPAALTTPGTTLATGVKFGTLANRPTSCTTGVGYYATDQGSWNTSGGAFGQGQFYKCTSTNTWTLTYTPYTYPHPLTSTSAATHNHRHTGGRSTGGRR
jgi:hypothetical protein